MPRDLDMIRNLKSMENLQAAKARYWADQIRDPDLRRICNEIEREHRDHQGRLDALEHQLGTSVIRSGATSVVEDRYQFGSSAMNTGRGQGRG